MPGEFVKTILKDLPSANQENFSRFSAETSHKGPLPKAKLLNDKKTLRHEKLIVCDKTPVLLRYLHQQWTKDPNLKHKRAGGKSDDSDDESAGASGGGSGPPPRKMPRTT
uniref:DET1- and DDB1-associated protein 1 n=2 Tax=Plectus sambesii TaxID=2011161 RepID=A0A914WNK5_9BILA